MKFYDPRIGDILLLEQPMYNGYGIVCGVRRVTNPYLPIPAGLHREEITPPMIFVSRVSKTKVSEFARGERDLEDLFSLQVHFVYDSSPSSLACIKKVVYRATEETLDSFIYTGWGGRGHYRYFVTINSNQ